MTWRQSIMKAIYPIIMLPGKLFGGSKAVKINQQKTLPQSSLYELSYIANNKDTISLQQYKGKKLLIVNTASNCGYTGQYAELETLYKQFGNRLQIIGFPANDFKEQETGSDEEIAQFCQINYGVSFPLASKSVVIKSKDQNPIFQWLSDAKKNGWNNQEPTWNFSKYLINEEGVLMGFFSQQISPLDDQIKALVEQ